MVRGLRPALVGASIERLRVLDARVLDGCDVRTICRSARGASVTAVDRRGKWVLIELAPTGGCIVIQPRMTGGFWLVDPPRPEHVRIVFELIGRRKPVWFCDTRCLGKVSCYRDAAEAARSINKSQGTDALEISLEALGAKLRATKRAIKPALLDQKILAGIGNIYADEVLFTSRIGPQRLASGLTRAEVARLHAAISTVLQAAIAVEGSTFDAGYRTVLGLEGGFLSQNSVYGREGSPCRVCATPIARVRFKGLIGRSTYFCPICQRSRTRAGRSGRISRDVVDSDPG